ncbi:MAG TPA: trigger factor [Candidatus Dormibacteraeota bacterium]
MPDTASSPQVAVDVKTLPKSRLELTFDVPAERVDATYDRVLNRLAQRVKIEGFRPGKAPRAVLEARLGPTTLREEVIDALVPNLVAEALTEREIEPVDRPQVEVAELERGRPGRFVATLTVLPEVKLPDLTALNVTRPSTTVDDQLVDRRVDELREQKAILEPVERAVQVGDVVVLDLDVVVDGEALPDEERRASEIEVREGVLIPELLAVLPGTAVDETKEAEITLPDEHPRAGTAAVVRATVRGVKEKHLPELDDELAKELSDGKQDTVDAFRAAVREDLEETAKQVERLAFEQGVVKAAVEGSEAEIPDALIDLELDRRQEELEHALGHQGLRLDAYLSYQQTNVEDWRARQRDDAEARVRTDLVLDAVARQESIQPAEADVRSYMQSELERDPELQHQLGELMGSSSARRYFERRLRRLRTLERLVEMASPKTS